MAECGGPCSVGSGSSAFLHESASGQSTLEIALGLPSLSLSPLTLSFFLSLASPATHTKRSCSWWCLCVGYTEEKKEVREWVAGNVVGRGGGSAAHHLAHHVLHTALISLNLSHFHPFTQSLSPHLLDSSPSRGCATSRSYLPGHVFVFLCK